MTKVPFIRETLPRYPIGAHRVDWTVNFLACIAKTAGCYAVNGVERFMHITMDKRLIW